MIFSTGEALIILDVLLLRKTAVRCTFAAIILLGIAQWATNRIPLTIGRLPYCKIIAIAVGQSAALMMAVTLLMTRNPFDVLGDLRGVQIDFAPSPNYAFAID